MAKISLTGPENLLTLHILSSLVDYLHLKDNVFKNIFNFDLKLHSL